MDIAETNGIDTLAQKDGNVDSALENDIKFDFKSDWSFSVFNVLLDVILEGFSLAGSPEGLSEAIDEHINIGSFTPNTSEALFSQSFSECNVLCVFVGANTAGEGADRGTVLIWTDDTDDDDDDEEHEDDSGGDVCKAIFSDR